MLIEHQSTWNENIPLRMLPYIDHVYAKIIKLIEAQRAMYQETRVKIPTPKFYMLYNGKPRQKERDELLLSDAFEESGGDLELRVHVIDISYSETNDILKACAPLYGYSYLVHRIRYHKRQGDSDDDAIAKAIIECSKAGILTDFLKKNGKEVTDMFRLQWNEKDAQRFWKEEAEAKGMKKGMEKGRIEGIAATTLKIVRNLLKGKKLTYEEIAASADTTVEDVIRIAKESHLAY